MMKSTFTAILFLMLSSTVAYAQNKETHTKAEKAILETIELESEYFWGRNYDKWASLYIHAPYTVWTSASSEGVSRYEGWEEWRDQVKKLFENDPDPQPYKGIVHKYNYNFRIYGKGAWVSFEQMNDGTKTLETRIMEKENGKWKIAMVEVIFNANEPISDEGDTGE